MEEYTLIRCNSGFVIKALSVSYPPEAPKLEPRPMWAFSTIDEAAEFLKAQYAPPPVGQSM